MRGRFRAPLYISRKLVLLFLVASHLAGCGQLTRALFPPEFYSYRVPYPNDPVYTFERYLLFANSVAAQWDTQANLQSIARLTQCDSVHKTAGQQILVTYWRSQAYWFGSRIEWFEVVILPDQTEAVVRIRTSSATSWEESPLDVSVLGIDYAEAMQIALDRGGAQYIANHSDCFQRVVLIDNQWNFEYMEDQWGVSEDKLRLCIDGITGESCQFFYLDP